MTTWFKHTPEPDVPVLAYYDDLEEYHVLYRSDGKWYRAMEDQHWAPPDRWSFLPPVSSEDSVG